MPTARLAQTIRRSLLAISLTLLAGCNAETLFETNFNATPPGQPPAPAQPVGTAGVFGPPGSVVVAAGVDPTTTRWVQIGRANNKVQIAGMLGTLSAFRGPGQYTFLCAMFMPSGSGLATISFDPVGLQPGDLTNFLHLDFTTDNMVRLDDNDATKFGTFPRNQPFDVIVTLNTAASPATAHIALIGTGASGSTDYTILSPFQPLAQQFDGVTVWMGYPWTGYFDATDLLVTHNLN